MTHRIHNFCAGPCTLPLAVLEEARAELTDFQGCGMSVLEISHRSARFEALHEETLALAMAPPNGRENLPFRVNNIF